MKYTLNQRDENFAGTDDDLDYMLARYYSQHLGRFMSCDPVRGDATRLKTLNRYAYAWGNPVKYVDPDGKEPCITVIEVDIGDGKPTRVYGVIPGCHGSQELLSNCSDPIASRLDPECTGQDSWTENLELYGGDPRIGEIDILNAPADGWEQSLNALVSDGTAQRKARCATFMTQLQIIEPSFYTYEHFVFLGRDGRHSAIFFDSENPGNPRYPRGLWPKGNIRSRFHGHRDRDQTTPSGADTNPSFPQDSVFIGFQDAVFLWQTGGKPTDLVQLTWAFFGRHRPSAADCTGQTIIDVASLR